MKKFIEILQSEIDDMTNAELLELYHSWEKKTEKEELNEDFLTDGKIVLEENKNDG